MNDDRFDHLTRRRTAVTSLLGGGLLALVTRLEPVAAARKRRKKKKRRRCLTCGPGTRRCQTQCIPSGDCCGGCGDQTCCDGSCANLVTDGANCGFCGNACFRNLCFNGACACSPAPDEGCSGGCDCLPRLEGGFGCTAFGQPGAACTTDGDCPFGTFCANHGGTGNCSLPCLPVT